MFRTVVKKFAKCYLDFQNNNKENCIEKAMFNNLCYTMKLERHYLGTYIKIDSVRFHIDFIIQVEVKTEDVFIEIIKNQLNSYINRMEILLETI